MKSFQMQVLYLVLFVSLLAALSVQAKETVPRVFNRSGLSTSLSFTPCDQEDAATVESAQVEALKKAADQCLAPTTPAITGGWKDLRITQCELDGFSVGLERKLYSRQAVASGVFSCVGGEDRFSASGVSNNAPSSERLMQSDAQRACSPNNSEQVSETSLSAFPGDPGFFHTEMAPLRVNYIRATAYFVCVK